jgi:hypothetical protein
MSDFDWTSDFDRLSMRYAFALGTSRRNSIAVIRPEPGVLPKPLEDAANAMHDAKSDTEAKMAANEFLTLSEEWVDRA